MDYRLATHQGATPIDSLWALWEDRPAALTPAPVDLTDSLEEITQELVASTGHGQRGIWPRGGRGAHAPRRA